MESSFLFKCGVISFAVNSPGHSNLNTIPLRLGEHFDCPRTTLQSRTSAAEGSIQSNAYPALFRTPCGTVSSQNNSTKSGMSSRTTQRLMISIAISRQFSSPVLRHSRNTHTVSGDINLENCKTIPDDCRDQ